MTYQVTPAVKTATPSDNPNTQPATLDTLPSEGFIRVMPLAQRLGIHHQTLRRWWKNGLFPKPQHRNGILLFSNSDVKEWIPHCQNSCHPHLNNPNGGKGDNHGTIQCRTPTSNIKPTFIT